MRPFLRWPHPVLRARAPEVAAVDGAVCALWDEMVAVMEAMPGYGLAAPQIGVSLRLAVVDASAERGQAVRMANPVLLSASPELMEWEEASPNLPGLHARISRPRAVRLAFLGPEGPEEREFEGLWAISAQHQMDHLEGRMYFDRLSRTRRDMLLRKARKG